MSAGPIADLLIPYETVHNHFPSGRVLLAAAKSILVPNRLLQSGLVGFWNRDSWQPAFSFKIPSTTFIAALLKGIFQAIASCSVVLLWNLFQLVLSFFFITTFDIWLETHTWRPTTDSMEAVECRTSLRQELWVISTPHVLSPLVFLATGPSWRTPPSNIVLHNHVN